LDDGQYEESYSLKSYRLGSSGGYRKLDLLSRNQIIGVDGIDLTMITDKGSVLKMVNQNDVNVLSTL
jgi:hypothetical protein